MGGDRRAGDAARRRADHTLTGPRGKAANLNHALRLTSGDFVATIDADHRADADLGRSVAALVRRRAGRLRRLRSTVRRRRRRAQQPAAVVPRCAAASQGRRRLRDLVRERRDLPPRRARRRQWVQRVEPRRGPAHVVPPARRRVDERVRARAGHHWPGAEDVGRVRPPAGALDGRRAAAAAPRQPAAAARPLATCPGALPAHDRLLPARPAALLFLLLPPLYLVLRVPAAGASSTGEYLSARGAVLRPAGRLLRITRRRPRGAARRSGAPSSTPGSPRSRSSER